ncbi:MAG: LysM peptidoglycan-binding domain-containing protein, partial [Patescibacteria group bacterium]|nr:LysM peptidoglycan-binding domain-containing protein [Patescibacteria group bacterium]
MKLYSSRTKRQPVFGRRLITGALFLCVAFIAFLIYTETVNAGLISFVNSAFLGTIEASADVQSAHTGLTTETMTLLSAHANINPTSDLALEIAPVDDGEALSPDIASIDATSTDTGSQTISTYVVRSGDTLSEIAEMFNVSVNTILWANDISRTAPLQPGQTLIILPVSGINYTVKSGDTIQGVVSKYKADINEVLRFND